MTLRKEDCGGVWVPAVTPFHDDALRLDLLPPLVEHWLAAGVRGLLALGTTGEAPHVSDGEAVQVVRAVTAAAAGRVPVVAGSGRASTAATIELGLRLAEAGASALFVLTPYAYRARMDATALRRHYELVAERAPVPLFVYHMPDLTGLDLEPDVLSDLLLHPNVWGFKDSSTSGGPLQVVLGGVRALGFVGSGARVLEALDAGASGAILAIANAAPEPCIALFDAWRARDLERARALQERAALLVQALRPWGVAGVKAAMAARGWDAGEVRAPLAMPPGSAKGEIDAALERALHAP